MAPRWLKNNEKIQHASRPENRDGKIPLGGGYQYPSVIGNAASMTSRQEIMRSRKLKQHDVSARVSMLCQLLVLDTLATANLEKLLCFIFECRGGGDTWRSHPSPLCGI